MELTVRLCVPQVKQQNIGSESYDGKSDDGLWTFAMCLDVALGDQSREYLRESKEKKCRIKVDRYS